jgi:putative Mn2+ efflux pump MntP
LWAIVLSLVYALTSSAYPIIGFLLASSVSYIPKYERAARVAGAAAMILVGVYMIVNESLRYVSPRGD